MAAVSVPLNGHVLNHQRSLEKDHVSWERARPNSQEVSQSFFPQTVRSTNGFSYRC